MRQKFPIWFVKVLRIGITAILVVAPFYLTLSIWAYQFIKHLDLLKIWEEVGLSVITIVIIGFLTTHRVLAWRLLKNRLTVLLLLYALLIVGIGTYDLLSGQVSNSAVIYGWLTDLRPIAIFWLALLTVEISQLAGIKRFAWRKVLMIPAVIAILFGFLQATVLPNNFLSHFGYGPTTTLPYQTVDNQPSLVRVQSTMRGPDPFGAYIMVILLFVVGWYLVEKKSRPRLYLLGFGLLSLYVMYKTYSRSAELAFIISLIFLLVIKADRRYLRRHLVAIGSALVAAGAVLAIALAHHNYLAQNVLLHTSNRSTSAVSSNAQRAAAEKQGVKDIIHHPLGTGVGSAGPASRRNAKGPARIAENYFLQIGQELGIVGLVMFIVINIFIGHELWRRRSEELSSSLLAALVGLTIVCMFYHTWTDETLAYIWWGLAGIALAPAILTDRHKLKNGKNPQTT